MECGNYTLDDINAWLATATATDDCDEDVEVTNDFDPADLVDPCEGSGNPFEIIVNFWATDNCGNVSDCSAKIQIEDNTPPVLTCASPDPLVLECGNYTLNDINAWFGYCNSDG